MGLAGGGMRGARARGVSFTSGASWGVLQRRQAARQEELDEDFSYARELRDRERRLRALEEQLERKARWAAGGAVPPGSAFLDVVAGLTFVMVAFRQYFGTFQVSV